MGVLGAFFGCRGDGGFNGRCSGACIGDGGFTLVCISGRRGVIGFNAATSQQPVHEKVRPARLDVGVSAKKFAQRTNNGPQWAFLDVLGEFCRGNRWVNVVAPLTWRACPAITRGPVGRAAHRGQPGRSKSRVIARNEAPAPASCGGGRQHTECLEPRQCKRR